MSTRLRVLTVGILLSMLLLLAGCGGGSSTSGTTTTPLSIVVTPLTKTISVFDTLQFTATVTGGSNTAVTWSATKGEIDANGLYTPPVKAGTYRVYATSVADPTQKMFATVVVTAPEPVVSTDPTAVGAVENELYTLELAATDPAETAVSFELVSGPEGAELDPETNTITWTPTPAQSRVPNDFVVTVSTAAGGTTDLEWTVAPAGTVTVSYLETFWSSDGTSKDVSWIDLNYDNPYVAALVPSSDGKSLDTINATDNEDGTFTLTAVPAGHYWLRFYNDAYWTDSSVFDFGEDNTGRPWNELTSVSTTLDFDLTGLVATYEGESYVELASPNTDTYWGQWVADDSGALQTTFAANLTAIDPAKGDDAYVLQYDGDAEETAEMTGDVWVESLISGLALPAEFGTVSAGTTNVHGVMGGTPKAFDVSVKGSEWANLLYNSGPSLYDWDDFSARLAVVPYVDTTKIYAWGNPGLAWIDTSYDPTDQEHGSFNYVNPYPEAWKPVFSADQWAEYAVVPLGWSEPVYIGAGTSYMTTAIPDGAIAPIMSGPQNAKINGNNFFTSSTSSGDVTLAWEAPTGLAAYGYEVEVIDVNYFWDAASRKANSIYYGDYYLYTSETSLTIPPGMLQPGETYVFILRAGADARAKMDSMPWRNKLPMADAAIVSGAVTIIGSSEPVPTGIQRMKAAASRLRANGGVTAQRLMTRKLRSAAVRQDVAAAKAKAQAQKSTKQPTL